MKRHPHLEIKQSSTTSAPIVVLALSASICSTARGEDVRPNPVSARETPSGKPDQAYVSNQAKAATSNVWLIPFDGDKQSNSDFLRNLLLSHGIEINLGSSEYLDVNRFVESIKAASEVEVSADELDLTLILELDTLFDMPQSEALTFNVSDQWEVIWLDISNEGDFDEPGASERARQAVEKKLSSPESQWQLDVLISRPATKAELEALKQQGKYPKPQDPSTVAPTGAIGRQQSLKAIPNAAPRRGALRRWLSTLPLEVDLQDDCKVQNAIQDYLKNPAAQSPGFPRDKAAGDQLMNGSVSAEWEVRWLDCEIDLDIGDSTTGRDAASGSANTAIAESEDGLGSSVQTGRNDNAPITQKPTTGTDTTSQVSRDDAEPSIQDPTPGSLVPPINLSLDKPKPDVQSSASDDEAAEGVFDFGDDVPEGFENMAGPQTQYIDLYFNERNVGSTTITATPEVFTFDQPVEVAQMLSGIKASAPLHTMLAEVFDTNGHLICYSEGDPPGCGYIDADPIAAIYDEAQLRVDLFVASALQSVQALERLRYLPVPGRKNTSILSLHAVASELEGEEAAADASARALLGYGRGNFSLEADYNSRTDRRRLREFKLTHFFNDYELQAGTYSYSPGGGFADINLLGSSFATSFKTRIDLERAFSSELIVFLQRQSVVQIAIDDRVYSGGSYEAGNQAIDTTALPDGSYQIEIRIIDPVNGTRTETRSFTKSALIPPKGESIVGMTAGNVLEFGEENILPEVSNVPVVGFSIANRFSDNSAYRLGLLQFGTQSLVQSEFIYLGERISLQLAASVGDDETVVSALRAAYVKNGISLNLLGSTFSSEFDAGEQTAYQMMFPNDYEQVGFSIGKAYPSFSVGARGSYRRDESEIGTSNSEQYSIYFRRSLFRRKHLRGFFDANLQQDDLDRRVNLQFNMYYGAERWSAGFTTAAQRPDSGNWDSAWGLTAGLNSSSAAKLQWQTGAYLRSEQTGRSAGANVDVKHPWFSAGVASDWNELSSGETVQNSVASVSAHIGLDGRGAAIGGADFAQAGVIVAVDGEPEGSRFDIVVNNIKMASGQIGTSQFIGLQPFERYSIKLVPQSTLSNGLGEEIHEFTLYPGTVERIAIVAKQKVLLVGTLVDESGELIANALLQTEPNPLIVDNSGYVQAELAPGAVVTVKLADNSFCQFTVPDPGEEDILVLAEPITCQVTSEP